MIKLLRDPECLKSPIGFLDNPEFSAAFPYRVDLPLPVIHQCDGYDQWCSAEVGEHALHPSYDWIAGVFDINPNLKWFRIDRSYFFKSHKTAIRFKLMFC